VGYFSQCRTVTIVIKDPHPGKPIVRNKKGGVNGKGGGREGEKDFECFCDQFRDSSRPCNAGALSFGQRCCRDDEEKGHREEKEKKGKKGGKKERGGIAVLQLLRPSTLFIAHKRGTESARSEREKVPTLRRPI